MDPVIDAFTQRIALIGFIGLQCRGLAGAGEGTDRDKLRRRRSQVGRLRQELGEEIAACGIGGVLGEILSRCSQLAEEIEVLAYADPVPGPREAVRFPAVSAALRRKVEARLIELAACDLSSAEPR